MKGDIALAGFMMTAQEWHALDAPSRALLMAIAMGPEPRPDEGHEELVVAPVLAIGSAPVIDDRGPR